nr:sodium/bile acid cotransporter 7-B-like [Onthophagus taurus]
MGRIKPSDFVRKNFLLVGIISSIFLAGIYPKLGSKNGPLKPEFTVKYLAVTLIFLLSGLSIKTENLFDALKQTRIHSFIQIFTFVFIPCFMQIFIWGVKFFNVDDWILKGLITVGCMPPPVSSAVILTRAAQGNEAAAIFNSVLGSFLGVVITPFILLLVLGYTAIVPTFGTILELVITVLFPIIIGQCIRKFTNFRGYNLPLNSIGQGALLFIVYCTFCDTFSTPELGLSASDVLITVLLETLMKWSKEADSENSDIDNCETNKYEESDHDTYSELSTTENDNDGQDVVNMEQDTSESTTDSESQN